MEHKTTDGWISTLTQSRCRYSSTSGLRSNPIFFTALLHLDACVEVPHQAPILMFYKYSHTTALEHSNFTYQSLQPCSSLTTDQVSLAHLQRLYIRQPCLTNFSPLHRPPAPCLPLRPSSGQPKMLQIHLKTDLDHQEKNIYLNEHV